MSVYCPYLLFDKLILNGVVRIAKRFNYSHKAGYSSRKMISETLAMVQEKYV